MDFENKKEKKQNKTSNNWHEMVERYKGSFSHPESNASNTVN